ncbi:MAG: hypothetical protein PHG00_01870 [Methylococcales bacterium]|nr:hypothetical protein [Methylococcales bacterium]
MLVYYPERLVEFWREAGSLVVANEKTARRNGMVTFLGHPDPAYGIDFDVLHNERTHPHHWSG